MKKILITSLLLLTNLSFADFYQSHESKLVDISRYKELISITVKDIVTPKVVIYESDENLDISKTILLNSENVPINHKTNKDIVWSGDKILAVILKTSAITHSAENILDNNNDTFIDFSTDNVEHFIEVSFPLNTKISQLSFLNDVDSIKPRKIKLENIIDGKVVKIIDWKDFSSTLKFPEIETSQLKISVQTPHLWRLKELEFGNKTRKKEIKTQLIFFGKENKNYRFYYAPAFKAEVAKIINKYPLNTDNKTPKFLLNTAEHNIYFNDDFDLDGIIDNLDLCPENADAKNLDIDNNQRGDICEDPDQDGFISGKDNCPFIYNPRQKDQDSDGEGDLCDNENNQITEDYAQYFTSLLFALFAGILGFLIWRSLKDK